MDPAHILPTSLEFELSYDALFKPIAGQLQNTDTLSQTHISDELSTHDRDMEVIA